MCCTTNTLIEMRDLKARVKAICDEGEMIWFDAPEWAVDGVRQFTDRILAALEEADE